MSTRQPDRYERETLDEITGPEGSLIRVVPLGNAPYNYEGILIARVLTGARTLDALVIDLQTVVGTPVENAPIRTTVRWAAVEAVLVLDPAPEEARS